MPSFTRDYFDSLAPVWAQIFSPAVWKRDVPRVVVEVGAYEGRSSIWIAENLLTTPDSRLYCIDIWDLEGHEGAAERWARFRANIAELPNADQVRAVRARSDDALADMRAQGLRADFVYIDGSHAAPQVLSDLVLAFGLLKRGGLIICDDYLWVDPRHPDDPLLRPKMAIDAFTSIYARSIHMPTGYPARQVLIQKT
jgi:predicted O-methyltransferase YrrM